MGHWLHWIIDRKPISYLITKNQDEFYLSFSVIKSIKNG